MRDTWLVKNYRHVLRRSAPTNQDFEEYPFVFIDIVTNTAYVSSEAGVWVEKAPDKVIVTPSNSIFVIEIIAPALEIVTFQGEQVTINGEAVIWQKN